MAVRFGGSSGGGGGGSGTVTGVLGSAPIASDGNTTTPTISLIAGALPNGMTATTQGAGDATTKVATDAFVTTAVNNAIAGVNPAVAVVVATTQASDTSGLTYNNGVAGIGATFTGSNNTALTFDGVTLTSLTQRVLVKNDTQSPSGAFNGVYTLTQLQTAILPPILTRALDFDQPSDINSTGAIPVTSGAVNASTSWVVTSTVATMGTDPITFAQFTVAPLTLRRSLFMSGAAVSAGSDTTEDTLATINVPALAARDAVMINLNYTHNTSANNKTFRVRFSGISGTVAFSRVDTTGTGFFLFIMLKNQGLTNSQVWSGQGVTTGGSGVAVASGSPTATAIDTTVATTILITAQKATNTDTMTLDFCTAELVTNGT